jgi:hypothetical protein
MRSDEHSGAEGVGVYRDGNVYGSVVRRMMLEKHILILFIRDSGGNQAGLISVAETLNEEWAGSDAKRAASSSRLTPASTSTSF